MATVPNGQAINGGDFPVTNLSGVAIPAFAAVVFDVANPPTFDQAPTVKVPATSGAVTHPAGITMMSIPIGGQGIIRRYGSAKATASGTVAIGDFVAVDATAAHEGQVKLAGSGVAVLGQCLIGGLDATEVLIDVRPGFTAP